jgi:hypothetical protein
MNVITEKTEGFNTPPKTDLLYLVVHPFSNRWSTFDALNFPETKFSLKEERGYLEKILFLLKNQQSPLVITQPDWYFSEAVKKLDSLNSAVQRYIVETPGDIWEGDIPKPKIGWEKFANFLQLFESKIIVVCGAQLKIRKEGPFKEYVYCVGETYNQLKRRIKHRNIRLEKELCLTYDSFI